MESTSKVSAMRPPQFLSEPGDSYYGTPKEFWDFRTPPSDDSPRVIARRFLRANADRLGLTPSLKSLSSSPKVVQGLGGTHVLYRQVYRDYPVHKGFVTVHIDNFGRVYMCKCRAIPENRLRTKDLFRWSSDEMRKAAPRVLRWKRLRTKSGNKSVPRNIHVYSCKRQWFLDGERMRPCYRVRINCREPKESWTLFFRADTKRLWLLEFYNGILLASPPNRGNRGATRSRKWKDGVGLVFAPNPVVAGCRHEDLLEVHTEHYETVSGDEAWHTTVVSKKKAPPLASYQLVRLPDLHSKARGELNGKRVDVRVSRGRRIVGETINQRSDHLRGPDYGYPHYRFMRFAGDQGFEEIMAYYFADAAIRWLEKLGYTGRRYMFQKPGFRYVEKADGTRVKRLTARAKPKQMVLNVYHSHEDNAYYDPRSKQIYFGTGQVSELEDAELLLHELGHAIQDHICNGFGVTAQAAAIGEGFGDYFAASFFAENKPEAWKPTVMSWDGILYGIANNARSAGLGDSNSASFPPALRRVDEPLTAEDFDEYGYSHDNGKIWSATLWDIRSALGRETADKVIIDSHFELSPHTNFTRAARAIIHADANLLGGVNYPVLARIFLKRKFKIYGEVVST